MVRGEVVYCPQPGQVDLSPLDLPEGSTVADALRASGVLQRHGLSLEAVDTGVWFRACGLEQPLREHDQVQLYRPLKVDPKEARRQRYRGKRSGASGSPTR
jgi:putative ubiquitin-RnfH superfamily antitoxin RatB of RatAB toxin-antitoxin module